MQTPFGFLAIKQSAKGVVSIAFAQRISREAGVGGVVMQLQEYFDGKRRKFDLDLDLIGTDFQKIVWDELRLIPFGRTATYQDIARKIKRPTAVRAVANAISANPVAIVIPCHRVIRSDGSLGGYRWGEKLKKRLLNLEKGKKIA